MKIILRVNKGNIVLYVVTLIASCICPLYLCSEKWKRCLSVTYLVIRGVEIY